jgi:hypothetical protein
MASHLEGRTQTEMFENRVLRGIFGPKRDEVNEDKDHCIMRRFIICNLQQILLGC